MRERERERDALRGGSFRGAAVEAKGGWVPVSPLDLDVAEAEAADAERLQRRLLGGEPGGEVWTGPPARACIGELAGPEHALGERRTTLERPLEPLDLEQVDADRRISHRHRPRRGSRCRRRWGGRRRPRTTAPAAPARSSDRSGQ